MRIALLALAATAAACTGAAAQTGAPPPNGAPAPMRGMGGGGMRGGGMIGALMQADTNGDGVITREETIASADAMFDRLDANHDGVVTPDEMPARGGMRRGAAPPPGDLGAMPPPPPAGGAPAGLTRQQWRDRALRQFDRLDVNHDGKVDRTEIANYQEAMRERRMERRGGGTPPPPPPAGGQPQ